MNSEQVIEVAKRAISKPDCIDLLGVAHTNANYVTLNHIFRRFNIDTSHFIGIKAADYLRGIK